MRDPWGLNERAFAWWYPKTVGRAERAGLSDIRRELLANASGRTLEVGAGNGFNVPHYPAAVTELVLSEPFGPMIDQLREMLESEPPPVASWDVVQAGVDDLPFPDESFDTVVTGFVLCTVPDVPAALREFERVLRPGGRFLFAEHVRDKDGTFRGRFQDAIQLPHRYIAAGCHPNRRTAETIEASPLEVEWIERTEMPASAPSVRPMIYGAALSPAA